MNLDFEHGDPKAPKGHALVYYRSTEAPGQLLMTYVVVLPVAVNVSKYMPPFLAPQLGALAPAELSSFAFPPVPELLEADVSPLALAKARGDDLIFGGAVSPRDVTGLLGLVNEAVQAYAEAYGTSHQAASMVTAEEAASGHAVTAVLYAFMEPQEKLKELSQMVGKLRLAVETRDAALRREAEEEVRVLGRYLPSDYRIERLLEAAGQPKAAGARLAQLYVERCYKLSREEYRDLGALDEEILALEAQQGGV
ncbi:MAG: hypothetical protein EXR55_03585 [Dehalococcoidia bacterium]|nr:hypothetical protein [Dehalococcoidia bacterium]